MKRILGATAGVLLCVGACGDDGATGESQAAGGKNTNMPGASGAGAGAGGEGGQAVTTPLGGSAGTGEEGGAPLELGGAGAGGVGGSPEVLSAVSGHITSFLGTPRANVVVIIGDASTVTDADGAFAIADVPASYELTAIDNELKFVQVVEGLTSREPRVGFWQMRLATRSGGVAGKLSGGAGFPLPAGQTGLISFSGKGSFAEVGLATKAGGFSLTNVNWEGDDTHQGLLTGIFWKTGVTGPTEYTGHAQRNVLLEADKTIGNVNGAIAATNLELVDPAEHTVTGTLSVAGSPLSLSSYLQVGRDNIALNLAAGAISVVVPEVDAPISLSVTGEFAAGTSGISVPLADQTQLDVTPPLPPQPVLPIEGALGVTLATEFSWKAPAAGSYSLVVWSMGDWSVARVTAATKVKLPDLTAAGVVYSEGDFTSNWHLEHHGPVASPEEALQLVDGTSSTFGSVVTTFGIAEREFQLAD